MDHSRVLAAFLAAQGVAEPLGHLWAADAELPQVPSALCYLEGPEGVLLIRRVRPPFVGCWTAPGGKLEPGEDPAAAAVRELREETGLTVEGLRLQVITSETGPRHYNWLLFVFRAHRYRGRLRPGDEGELRWIPFALLPHLPMPDVDRLLLPYIFPERFHAPGRRGEGPFFARIRYGAGGALADLQVRELALAAR